MNNIDKLDRQTDR